MEKESFSLILDPVAWTKSAEHELGAFLAAVTELFGAAEARHAADDWLDQFELQEICSDDVAWNWRRITVAAAIRLALRLNATAG